MTENDDRADPALPLNFDRSKPFYPLVVNYLILIHGYLDNASRVTIGRTREELSEHSPVPPTLTAGTPISAEYVDEFYSHPANRVTTRRATIPQLAATDGRKFDLDFDQLRDEYDISSTVLGQWMMRSAGVLFVTAWETTRALSTKSPEWEFLRHCRNAIAHDGAISLKNGEPRLPAEWNGIEITPASHGTTLFGNAKTPGLLWPGDPLYLLWDLEQTL